ncbi:nitroreductase family deazaflavin-dependent oxidoreductase [Actinomycetes bacterium KLBMP 9759]
MTGKPTTVIGPRRDTRPAPPLRLLARLPARLYAADLGWLLGNRFLCLTHIGRRSGRRHRTVLEVIATEPGTGEVLVIAALGPSSDWYRNIQANPAVEVTVGRHRFVPAHRTLDEPEAAAVLAGYERRNRWLAPVLRPVLSRLLGWRYDGSTTARRRMAQQLPVVALRPR